MSCSCLLLLVALAVCVEASFIPEVQAVHIHETNAADSGYGATAGTRTARGISECTEASYNCYCIDTGKSYVCRCRKGYTSYGHQCRDIDECAKGLDNCHDDANCRNNEGSFTCTCKSGYTGDGQECNDYLSSVVVGVYFSFITAVILVIIAIFISFSCRRRFSTLISGCGTAVHANRLRSTFDEDPKSASSATSSATSSTTERYCADATELHEVKNTCSNTNSTTTGHENSMHTGSDPLKQQEPPAADKALSGACSSATTLERSKREVPKRKKVNSHPVMAMQPESEFAQHYEHIDVAHISGDNIYAELSPAASDTEPPHHYGIIGTSQMRRDNDYAELCPATLDIGVTDNVAYGVGRVF